MQKRGQNRSFSLHNFSSKNRKGQRPTISSRRNRRGLSTIIVTLILILVSLVAVGIVWLVVRNVIQTGTEGVGLTQFSLSAKIMDVSINNNSNTVNLTVKRNAGQGDLTGISFIFSSDADTEVVTRNFSLKELEEKRFNFSLTKFNVLNLISVSIIPLIKQDGKEISGIALDKYTLGKNQNTQSGQTTCTPAICGTPGYMCGLRNNGSCSGNLNCGSCGSQATCPSGTCVCNPGWSDCNNDNACECDLSSNSCNGGSCVANPTGNIIYAINCSQKEVQDAVNSANRGDTIIVPAGNCIWTSTLTITKGITLRGAGIDATTIRGMIKLISYDPDAAARTNHETFKIRGFTFDGIGATSEQLGWSGLINLYDRSTDYVNAVIENNKFKNTTGTGVIISGTVYGVVSSNQFDRIESVIRSFGNNEYAWAAFSNLRTYGGSDNIFFENNTIGFSSPYSGSPGWIESGQGGRIVVRYNLWNDANTTGSEYWDVHGLQTPNSTGGNCQQYSTMVAEYYGNLRINTQSAYRAMYLRGGWLMQFNNVMSGSGSPPHTFGEYSCDECAAFGVYPQHINNTYVWNNLDDGTIKGLEKQFDDCTTYAITENRDYFNYNPLCTSASCPAGIGCGSTPPIGTCSTGTGYWVTSYSPCYSAPSTMDEMKTVTQSGRFYKCTASNTWTLYYTPYTYPHPLST